MYFSEGKHGLSLGNDLSDYRFSHSVNVESWITLCINWYKELLDF